MNGVLKVSLRQKAIFVPAIARVRAVKVLEGSNAVLISNMAKLGYGVSPALLQALNEAAPAYHAKVLQMVKEVMGVHKNWVPLVRFWNEPTGESLLDHVITYMANVFNTKGTKLACGHIIPANTFPLHRYNGCPFCGTPFVTEQLSLEGGADTLKVLELWTEKEAIPFLESLLTSKTALDATQIDSLSLLLEELDLPKVEIAMKETRMVVIKALVALNKPQEAQVLLDTPADIMRYLWYVHTGHLQVIEPAIIIKRKLKNKSAKTAEELKGELKLKYSRKECLTVAGWLNNMSLPEEAMCEIMHAKRAMWVRFIRALRLAEYSKREGFEKLNILLDKFYNRDYLVWQGMVNNSRLRFDVGITMRLLQQRPGAFARSLFANMLWFGKEEVVAAFAEVIDKIPARLVFTLDMYAENYFSKGQSRVVKPLGGVDKLVPGNMLLDIYEAKDLQAMREEVTALCKKAIQNRFAKVANTNKSMFIAPELFKIPVSIGDRSNTVQDMPSALMGTRFMLEGDAVRLFMQWGKDMPAQNLDMDLSCLVVYKNRVEMCSYSSLVIDGCKHSGDIRSIPHKTGTAEYIEIYTPVLRKAGAEYVIFSCNAYSNGAITPNLVVGWMNCKHPMAISEQTGVAYNPAHVQHQVRVNGKLDKGLVFGILDVAKNEVIWLEMPFGGQVAQNMDIRAVKALLQKLSSKVTIGELLTIKAAAQKLQLIEVADADEIYSAEWGVNSAAVTALLID